MTTRAVLFDAVGTLIYPYPAAVDVYATVGRNFGSQRSRDDVDRRFHAAFRTQQKLDADGIAPATTARPERYATGQSRERQRWQRIVQYVFDDLPDAAGELFEALWQHFADGANWRLFDDVAPVSSQLERRGLVLGIASNFDDRLFPISQSLEPLAGSQHVFCSSRIGYAKPASQFFHAIQERLDLPPAEILLVGDDWQCDVQGARRAGWQAVHVDRSLPESNARSVHSLSELVPRLD